jgi:spore coat protein U-like protein
MVAATYTASSGVTVSIPIYAKILSSAASIPPGTYTDTYAAGAQASIANNASPTNDAASECTGASGVHPWNATPFTVSVTLAPSCSVTASPLNFGVAGVLSANIDAATNLSVTCTYTTPYSVALSAGNGAGATTSTRAMSLGGNEVDYALYRDASRTLNWGSNVGVDTYAGVGTGAAQSVPVYGRVPPQATPPIGDYSDTVVVTINY